MLHTFSQTLRTHKQAVRIGIAVVAALVALTYVPRCVTTKVCGLTIVDKVVRGEVTVKAPQGSIEAEIVDTVESRELGLSGRNTLKEGRGMLFVFPQAGRYGFWMKDMNFPIDILWINEQGVVVHVVENAKPEDYPAQYVNTPDALYVLELSANRARALGIYLGVKLEIAGQK
jgi:uncharacterized membrane protein (UPF0127 family)